MNATSTTARAGRNVSFRKRWCPIILIGTLAWIEYTKPAEPFFNDANYNALRRDLDATIALPDGSPEQTVAYMKLGKHLNTPIYGKWTGLDVCRWVRDPNNPIRPLLRKHPQLAKDWELKDADGLSNADHYRGFVAGPVSGARILFQESAPEHRDRLNELLVAAAGTDPESLDLVRQEALLDRVLLDTSDGRGMLRDLNSRRLIGAQARGYRTLTEIAGTVGLGLRWTQRNCLWLLGAFVLVRAVRRAQRGKRSLRASAAGRPVQPARAAELPAKTITMDRPTGSGRREPTIPTPPAASAPAAAGAGPGSPAPNSTTTRTAAGQFRAGAA